MSALLLIKWGFEIMQNKAKDLKLYATDLANPDDIPWSSNYNAIEVNPEDLEKLMTLVFHDKIADAFRRSDTHVAPGVPDNHINDRRIEYDYITAVKALYQGHSIQIFNWDINIEMVRENFINSQKERFMITMPDGMPGYIAEEIWTVLRPEGIGMIYHL